MGSDNATQDELLRRMAEDESVPTHLRLGALKELGRRRQAEAPAAPAAAPSGEGLPPNPLLERYPDEDPDGPLDPMADLDFAEITGRAPHRLYAKVLHSVPPHANRAELLRFEAEFLRACRDAGIPRGARRRRAGPSPVAARQVGRLS